MDRRSGNADSALPRDRFAALQQNRRRSDAAIRSAGQILAKIPIARAGFVTKSVAGDDFRQGIFRALLHSRGWQPSSTTVLQRFAALTRDPDRKDLLGTDVAYYRPAT